MMQHGPQNILWRPQGLFLSNFVCVKFYVCHIMPKLTVGYCKLSKVIFNVELYVWSAPPPPPKSIQYYFYGETPGS